MPNPIDPIFQPQPMPASPSGGPNIAARATAMPQGQSEMLAILMKNGFNPQDPASANKMIQSMRESGNQTMANAAENLMNYLSQGRDVPASMFDLPDYKQTPGYR